MKKTNLVTLLIVTLMLAGSFYIQPISQTQEFVATEAPVLPHTTAGYDSENITVVLISPANQSTLVGTVDLNVTITSVNGPINITLLVDDEIYFSNYNGTEIAPGSLNLTIDTTVLPEGLLNFTILLEDNSTGANDKETYRMLFTVDNHGVPSVELLSPADEDIFTGLDNLTLNITADYEEVFLNVTVDGKITSEFNATLVPVGAGNFTINGTRYENGNHQLGVVVYTEEGLQDSLTVNLVFLDYVRFLINDITAYAVLAGSFDFDITLQSPFDRVTIDLYVNDAFDSSNDYNVTEDSVTFTFDTTAYSEGEHNFTFIASDEFNHTWTREWIFVIDNHGTPEIGFVSPTEDVVVGLAAFTVNIESTWDFVNVTVYVDDVRIANYTDVEPGEFTFFVDTNLYSKWEHTLKVVVETEEGETAEAEDIFGFANIKIEEILSLVVLLGIAFAIPIMRKRRSEPIRPIIILDVIYLAIIAAGFIVLGVTTFNYAVWHFNLGSIWILGSILVILNWIFPLLKEE